MCASNNECVNVINLQTCIRVMLTTGELTKDTTETEGYSQHRIIRAVGRQTHESETRAHNSTICIHTCHRYSF